MGRTLAILGLSFCTALAACGDDDEPRTYTVNGTVVGLEGGGLVLDLNGTELLPISSNGTFGFATRLGDGEAYAVNVSTQPSGPDQTCTVEAGTGEIAGMDVANVLVTCQTEDATAEVAPLYPDQGGWADCILADGADPLSASGAACTGAGPCLQVGSYRTFPVESLSSCADVTARDTLGVFEWTCEEVSGAVHVVSTGFGDDHRLADLIDVADLTWRPMAVIVEQGGTEVARSDEALWWDNPIAALPTGDGSGPAVLDAPGTIYVLAADAVSDGVLVDADNVAVVTGGATLTYSDSGTLNCNWATGEGANADQECLVAVGSQRCVWLEGSFDGGAADTTVHFADTHHSVVWDADVAQGGHGLELGAGSSGNLVRHVWIGDSLGSGLVLLDGATRNLSWGMLIEDTGEDGVYLYDAHDNTFRSVSSNDTGDEGWDIEESTGNAFERVWAYGNAGDGFNLDHSSGNRFEDVEVGWVSGSGYELDSGSAGNRFVDIRAREVQWAGVVVYDSPDNRFYHTRVGGVGFQGVPAIALDGGSGAVFVDTVIHSSGGDGFYTDDSTDVTVVGLLSTSASEDGFHASDGTVGLTVGHLTAVNNNDDGVELHNTDQFLGAVVFSAVSAGNLYDGLNVDDSTTLRVHDLAAYGNGGDGVELENNDDVLFSGILAVGANGNLACEVIAGGAQGLAHTTCANLNGSDAALNTSVVLAASFGGALAVDEPDNDDDTLGAATTSDIDDWLSFASPYRTWGRDGTGWPDAANLAGACFYWDNCRIWDWRLVASDSALHEVHGAGTAGAACPASVHGDVVATDAQSTPNTFLLHAMELVLDGVGDDDGLCESNETCVYAPSLGAYQGEGDPTGQTCTFTDGVVSGVTLLVFPQSSL